MSDKDDVLELFGEAEEEGFDKEVSQIMVANLDAIALAGCQGAEVDLIPTDEVTLVTVIHDGSGSMYPERDVVVESYRGLLDALRNSKQAESILVSDWIFNTKRNLVHGFVPVAQAPDLDASYHPDGETALYDTALAGLTGIVAYGQQLRANGVQTKNVVVVFSDGRDNASKKVISDDVRKVTQELLAQETFVLAYVGFSEYGLVDEIKVRELADKIGFSDVITAKNTPSDIRKIFRQVSASVIKVSQSIVKPGGFFAGS